MSQNYKILIEIIKLTMMLTCSLVFFNLSYAQKLGNYWQCSKLMSYQGEDGFVHSYFFNIPPDQASGDKIFKYFGFNMNIPDGVRVSIDGVKIDEFWVGKYCEKDGSGSSEATCRQGPAMWSNEFGSPEITSLTDREYVSVFRESRYFFHKHKYGAIHLKIKVPEGACQIKIDVLSNTTKFTFWQGVLLCPELNCPRDLDLIKTPLCSSTKVEVDYPKCDIFQQGNVTWEGPEPFQNTIGPEIETDIAGNYKVKITYANKKECALESSFTLDELSFLKLETTQVAPLCSDSSDGSLTVIPEGGTPPYEFLWEDGNTSSTKENIPAGVHPVKVTDSYGCEVTFEPTLTGPTAISANPQITSPTCEQAKNGRIQLNPRGGNGPYTYAWSTGEISPSISDLQPGTYTVTVIDSNQCVAKQEIQVRAGEIFKINFDQNNVSCYGFGDGSLDSYLTGVVTGLAQYQWNHGPTTPNLFDLDPNQYTLTVTDEAGCSVTKVATITQPDTPLSFSFASFSIQCEGTSNGYIRVYPQGGTPDYTASTQSGNAANKNLVIEDLPQGDHKIIVRDENGCEASSEASVGLEKAKMRAFIEYNNCQHKTTLEVYYPETNIILPGFPIDITDRTTKSDLGKNIRYSHKGCDYQAEIQLKGELPNYLEDTYIPNAFSPNGDGNNDIFTFYHYSEKKTVIDRFQVYDRWGNLVHSEKDFDAMIDEDTAQAYGWDGRLRGQLMNNEVYVYQIVFKECNHMKTGDVVLMK